MLLASNMGFIPLIMFSIIGTLFILNPKLVQTLKDYKPSTGKSLSEFSQDFTKSSILFTRIAGAIWILIGVYLFLLITYDVDILGIF
ncbi:hypothetical protein KQ51_00513 [Candidatus Izimaplasma bacterium HR1]|jgi:hypothetical protein|uniref:hypothetical protein n=1 Tax=Candidatus Izimoplasma sp. HR1 TaxID=1541959 RepID=UPI0004F70089|nr:hypothetical protein KQ51_00513 [Candidatus Izimaplasma bacterium HR1]